ncbi:MAG: ABC transporter ATP-binding protein [Cytophagales bacterium]|nr:MAG: ABC transporter ATP-binding protein [Cytophagales bacterium]TAF61386.1 MAG: ABC transporter ATP-binding protein [Cytophagales bacterium]
MNLNAAFQNRLLEIKQLLASNDINLATRRLLDLVNDYDVLPEIRQRAVAVRGKFNIFMQQSHPEAAEREEIYSHLNQLVLELSGQTFHQSMTLETEAPDSENSARKVVFVGQKLKKTYSSVRFALEDIDITLHSSQITGLVGENGNGKTTLLRIIAGDLALDSGFLAYPTTGHLVPDWYNIKQHIAFIPQHLKAWQGKLKDNLHFSAANHGIYGEQNEDYVDFIIHRLGLSRYRDSGWGDISSGYKLRFELARALVWHPKLLILDEPLANLDINTKSLFLQDLRLLADSTRYPIAIVLSSQQLHEIESVVDNIMFLREGKSIYNGSVKDFGVDRQTNTFEMNCEAERQELLNILLTLSSQATLRDTGQSYMVDVPTHITGNQLLKHLLSHFKVEYFRDISQSTRKLFQD